MPPASLSLAKAVPIDMDSFAPLAFQQRAGGRYIAMLGVWEVGEIAPDDRVRGLFKFRMALNGCAPGWRYSLALDLAQGRIVDAVRGWISAAGLSWGLEQR